MNKKKKTETLKADSFRPVAPSVSNKNKIVIGDFGENKNKFISILKSSIGRKFFALLAAVVLIGLAALAVVLLDKAKQEGTDKIVTEQIELANKAFLQDDAKEALVHAREAYEASPDNMDAILLLAELTKKENPEEARKLYAQALGIYKEETDFNDETSSAIQYWAVASLAEDAGLRSEALKYYKAVLIKGDPKDSYDSSLIRRSTESIERLREIK